MANHRADKRAVKAGSVVVPVASDHPTDRAASQAAASDAAGASIPTQARLMRAAGGRRRAVRPERIPTHHKAERKSLLGGAGTARTAVALAAMGLAAAGAVTVSVPDGAQTAAGDVRQLSAPASVRSGAGGAGLDTDRRGAVAGRQRAVSRDSQRQTLPNAADERLLAAARRQATHRKAGPLALTTSADQRAARTARHIWRLPVRRGGYHLTSRFGDCSALWSHCHTGLDFAAGSGTPIHAIAAGVVTAARYDGSYGNKTVEKLSDGTVLWYAHQTSYDVHVGQKVVPGQVIGSVGSTGNTTGPHVHIEVRPRKGHPVDPFRAFIGHGVKP